MLEAEATNRGQGSPWMICWCSWFTFQASPAAWLTEEQKSSLRLLFVVSAGSADLQAEQVSHTSSWCACQHGGEWGGGSGGGNSRA